MFTTAYHLRWSEIPLVVKRFFLKALFILVVWKVLYLFVLEPSRILDKPLTTTVGVSSAWLMNKADNAGRYSSKSIRDYVLTENGKILMPLQSIYSGSRRVVSIEDSCNALELMVLYAGFIISMPATAIRKLTFTIGGIIAIHAVNLLRCAGIGYIEVHYPQHEYFAHHYIFTFIVYGFIMSLWYLFAQKLTLNARAK